MKKLLLTLIACSFASISQAVIIQFDLIGTAGSGLLSGSEPSLPVPTNASGGEIGAGISYDDVLNLLTINIGWGSSQGFNDLSSAASASHIHGAVASNNGAGFTQTAGVFATLTRSSSAVTGGTFTNPPISFTAAQETDLLNGKFYVNLHTGSNPNGEIRGFLVPVPEPTAALCGMAALGALALRRRRA